jgi:hypothetical protein
MFVSLGALSKYKNRPVIKRSIIKNILLFILVFSSGVPIIILIELSDHYKLFTLPILAGLAITIIGLMIIVFCCYKWTKKTILKVFYLFIISTAIVFAMQFIYSYVHLKSKAGKEFISAFKMFLYPLESKAYSVYREAFNNGHNNDALFEISMPLIKDPEKARSLKDLWESGVDNKDPFKRALSITFLSMNGENENLYNHLFAELKEDSDFKDIFPPYEWDERLALLVPPSKRQEMTLDLLKSDNPKLRYIGYYCAQYFPSNTYIPPILESMKKEKREVGIEVATKTLSVIMLDDKKYQSVSVADVPKAIEGYEKWYVENGSNSFDDRLREMLQGTGHSSLISKMTNEELFFIYDKEIHERGSDHFLSIILENILLYRLKLVENFYFLKKFTGNYYSQSAYSIIKEKIQQNKPFPYRYISD